MTAPCPTCAPIECSDNADPALYSLESSLCPFVLNCPPGYSCSGLGTFSMTCCGQTITATFPPNATLQEEQEAIQQVINQCLVRNMFCGTATTDCGSFGPTTIFQNTPQTCSAQCPDGTSFFYTVPAGQFGAMDQATANANALAFACQQAQLKKLCLGALTCSGCVGAPFDFTIPTTGGVAPFTWIATSGMPPGLTLNSSTGEITGTPTTQGAFNIAIQVQAGGGSVQKNYTLNIIQITTTSLPPFTLNVPYSFQLQAVGGPSGKYAWKIINGALPPGLFLSLSGLISGTPTGAGTNPLSFSVIDQACQTADQSFYPPQASLSAQSTTQIATVLGWQEFPGFVSSPPIKFKTIAWTGSSEQQLWYTTANGFGPTVAPSIQAYTGTDPNSAGIIPPSQTAANQFAVQSGNTSYVWNTMTKTWIVAPDQTVVQQIAGARYDFSGMDQIDTFGNVISQHSKLQSVQCNGAGNRANLVGPTYASNNNYNVAFPFLGYFGTNKTFYSNLLGPTELCTSSSVPYTGTGDISAASPFQYPAADLVGLWGSTVIPSSNPFLQTATVLFQDNADVASNDNGATIVEICPYAPPLLPPGLILEAFSTITTGAGALPRPPDWTTFATILYTNSFSIQLQDQYTDAEALANARVIQGNGTTAVNGVRTTGFTSTFTNVVYTVTCSNLIGGTAYVVSVDLADITAGTQTTVSTTIIASGSAATVVAGIPQPLPGHSVQVRNPRITFA